MEIKVNSVEASIYGLPHAYLLSYLRQKGSSFTVKEVMDDLGYSESNVRQQLNVLEQYGLIKRHHKKGRGRAMLIGAEVLI